MAIDLTKLRSDLEVIRILIQELLNIVDWAKSGKVVASTIEIPFSQANKDALVARYQVLKSTLADKVGALP